MKAIVLFLFFSFGLLGAFAQDVAVPSTAVREAGAEKALANVNTVAVYAKGLCCSSCAIGIRKYISKLPFVDRKKPKSGVGLDAKAQLAIITLKPGAAPDGPSIAKAIRKAGYEPVELYQKKAGRVVRSFLK